MKISIEKKIWKKKSIGNMLLATLKLLEIWNRKNVINMKLATLNGQSGKFVKCH